MNPREHRNRDDESHIVTPAPIAIPEDTDEGTAFPLQQPELERLVRDALVEDGAFDDITTIATVLSNRRARATLVTREGGVIAGIPLVLEVFRLLDPRVVVRVDALDGGRVPADTPILFLSGHARAILSGERVALNFLQRLSGIATLTRRFVDAVNGTGASILDTRKTTPLLRKLEKFAVRAGGGKNHRLNLATGVLIKDNHLAAVDGDIAVAVKRARQTSANGTRIEVECESREQVEAAVAAGADVVMLDNMPLELLRDCVRLVRGRAITEASGGVTLENVRAIADTGVDRISVGALTHSAQALDLALDLD